MLAKVLKNGGNLIVLDEPTNDLDLPSLRMLEEALADFDGSVICVSHDRYFLDRICDQVIAFEDDGVFVQPGNYSYYLEKRKAREEAYRIQAQAAAQAAAAHRKASSNTARPRKLSIKERAELEGIEATIHDAETRADAMEALLNDPAYQAEHFNELPELAAKHEASKSAIHQLYERWELLEALRAAAEDT